MVETALDASLKHSIPYLAKKKGVEMERCHANEATRNPELQKKAIDYALSKATPFIKKKKQALK